jgi:peptidoglycan/LPS O-acetylase OafA/YrhL
MVNQLDSNNYAGAGGIAVAPKEQAHHTGQVSLARQSSGQVPAVSGSHYDSVQAMRALSVFAVVLFHVAMRQRQDFPQSDLRLAYPLSLIGHCGVDLFFIISGFIIATVNWRNFGKLAAIKEYAMKRLIRIFPIYWLTSVPLLLIGLPVRLDWKSMLGALALLPHYAARINIVAWSLSYEILFYASFAVALVFPARFLPFWVGLWFCLIVGDGLFPGAFTHASIVQDFLRPLNLEFVLGLGIAILVRKNLLFKKPKLVLLIGIAGLAAAMALKHFGPNPYPEYDGRMRAMLFGIPCALLLYAAIIFESFGKFVYPRLVLLIGDASYSIYLVHFGLIQLLMLNPVATHLGKAYQLLLWEMFVVAAVLGTGVFVHLKLEKPIMQELKVRLMP